MSLSERGRVEEGLQLRVTDIATRANARLGVEQLLPITDRLRAINQHVDEIDLQDLAFAPQDSLIRITRILTEFIGWFDEYIQPAAELERTRKAEMNRSDMHKLTEQNLSKWTVKLLAVENEIFYATGPLLCRQTRRKLQRSAGRAIQVEAGAIELDEKAAVWKYMPLANLLRTAQSGGLWFSSLAKLRAWVAAHETVGIPDTHEGEVPPVLKELKADFDRVQRREQSPESLFLKYPFARQHYAELAGILDVVFEPERVFAWSGILRKSEDANMWSAFAAAGKGVAIKTTVGKLRNAGWKIPFDLSGFDAGGAVFSGIIMRKVKYLSFTDEDRLESLDDCYVPFQKREAFESERELRLLGHTNAALKAGGVTIHCDLAALIDAIVIGPKAGEEFVRQQIHEKAPMLKSIPLVHSQLRGK